LTTHWIAENVKTIKVNQTIITTELSRNVNMEDDEYGNGYASLCYPFPVQLIDEDGRAKAYYCAATSLYETTTNNSDDGIATLEEYEDNKVPPFQGFITRKEYAMNFTGDVVLELLPMNAEQDATTTSNATITNMFGGVLLNTFYDTNPNNVGTFSHEYNCIFGYKYAYSPYNTGVGFRKDSHTDFLPAYKAYLNVESLFTSGAKERTIALSFTWNKPNSITQEKEKINSKNDAPIYNLMGLPINKEIKDLHKGIYIRGKKKIMVE
jgi:hypothetical protein